MNIDLMIKAFDSCSIDNKKIILKAFYSKDTNKNFNTFPSGNEMIPNQNKCFDRFR